MRDGTGWNVKRSLLPDRLDRFALPPFAYVPGQTDRHPEGWFDKIKASIPVGLRPSELHHSMAWGAGLAFFDAGFFWECHEVLEAVWLLTPDPSPERHMVQALIQLANARLKLRMRRPRATMRLCEMVRGHLAHCPAQDLILGLSVDDMAKKVQDTELITRREIEAL